jgi:lysyl-tRNA synthetase, class II
VLSVLILVGACFVVVSYLKGKLFVGTIGIFVPPVALIGAIRLAKPGSPWARSRYADNAVKMERARRRDESFHQLWERRKHAVWDVIGGKPHVSLPRRDRDGHHRDPGTGPRGDSRKSHV